MHSTSSDDTVYMSCQVDWLNPAAIRVGFRSALHPQHSLSPQTSLEPLLVKVMQPLQYRLHFTLPS
jgi:hypothetical protein